MVVADDPESAGTSDTRRTVRMETLEWLSAFVTLAVLTPLFAEITKDLYHAARRRMGLTGEDPDDG